MDDITGLETIHRGEIPVAEVKADNARLAEIAGVSEAVSRTALLSLIAAREALDDAAIPERDRWRTGIVSANTVGGMDLTEEFVSRGLSRPPARNRAARMRL